VNGRDDEGLPAATGQPPVRFEAPGPGYWELETTHHGLRPLSHLIRDAYFRAGVAGFTTLVGRYGLPIASIEAAAVEGCLYIRPKAVGEGDKPSAPPPKPIMWLLARLHPELRRRNRTAARAWADRLWRTEVDQWFDKDKQIVQSRNLELQSVDPAGLDNAELAGHLSECMEHFETGMRRNLETHGGDLVPTGDLLAHGEGWGIDASTMASLLVGCSPATVETAVMLRPVAAALATTSEPPDSIEAVRALGEEARAAVDAWIELHAWRLVTSDDIDQPTLAELPALQLRALVAATAAEFEPVDPSAVRSLVPQAERDLFDELLTEARYGHRQRDDIRGLCWNWPGGLVRRAMLEAGRRLTGTGQLYDPEHAAELSPGELDDALRNGTGPDADAAATRAGRRELVQAAPPPRSLGEPEAEPPLDAFPRPIARATAAMMTMLTADATVAQEPLHGIGIGDDTYRGRACVVRDAADAMDRLEPGDVLIASFTGPAFNSLLPIVGALVVEEGGTMCHAAIVAREFGVPALIGAAGATEIESGSQVEVDPTTGVIRVVGAAADSTADL
jgi:pyruvate,water dikinase